MKRIKQGCSLKARAQSPGWTLGVGLEPIINFSENGYVYQIKGNKAYNNMLANSLPYTFYPWGGDSFLFWK